VVELVRYRELLLLGIILLGWASSVSAEVVSLECHCDLKRMVVSGTDDGWKPCQGQSVVLTLDVAAKSGEISIIDDAAGAKNYLTDKLVVTPNVIRFPAGSTTFELDRRTLVYVSIDEFRTTRFVSTSFSSLLPHHRLRLLGLQKAFHRAVAQPLQLQRPAACLIDPLSAVALVQSRHAHALPTPRKNQPTPNPGATLGQRYGRTRAAVMVGGRADRP
jgi:hypothetical protein